MEIPSKFSDSPKLLYDLLALGKSNFTSRGESEQVEPNSWSGQTLLPPQTRQRQLAVGFWFAPKKKKRLRNPAAKIQNPAGKRTPRSEARPGHQNSSRGGVCPLTFLIMALVCNHTRASRSALRVLHARGMRRLRAGVDPASPEQRLHEQRRGGEEEETLILEHRCLPMCEAIEGPGDVVEPLGCGAPPTAPAGHTGSTELAGGSHRALTAKTRETTGKRKSTRTSPMNRPWRAPAP